MCILLTALTASAFYEEFDTFSVTEMIAADNASVKSVLGDNWEFNGGEYYFGIKDEA